MKRYVQPRGKILPFLFTKESIFIKKKNQRVDLRNKNLGPGYWNITKYYIIGISCIYEYHFHAETWSKIVWLNFDEFLLTGGPVVALPFCFPCCVFNNIALSSFFPFFVSNSRCEVILKVMLLHKSWWSKRRWRARMKEISYWKWT